MAKRTKKNTTTHAARRAARCAEWDAQDRRSAVWALGLAGLTLPQFRRALAQFDARHVPHAQRPLAWYRY